MKVEGDIATVGITDHAQEQLGDVVFVELAEVGKTYAIEDTMGAVESVKAASDVYSPVTGARRPASSQRWPRGAQLFSHACDRRAAGEIVEVNDKLTDEPSLVRTRTRTPRRPPSALPAPTAPAHRLR